MQKAQNKKNTSYKNKKRNFKSRIETVVFKADELYPSLDILPKLFNHIHHNPALSCHI